MHKWIMFVMLIAAASLGVYLLTTGMPEKPVDESASLPEGMQIMAIEAYNDFTFNEEAFTYKVGDKVRMKFTTTGNHGIMIDELQVDLDRENSTMDLEFTEPGEYIIYCDIPCGPGHATMQTKLIVEAA